MKNYECQVTIFINATDPKNAEAKLEDISDIYGVTDYDVNSIRVSEGSEGSNDV